MEGYAVSAQCMALVRDNCLVPTKDAPELGYIRESTDKQFVPDVYYKVSDIFIILFQYGLRGGNVDYFSYETFRNSIGQNKCKKIMFFLVYVHILV